MNRMITTLQKLNEHAELLKKETAALYLAYKRPDLPWRARIVIMIVVGYALSPIDLIPDFIPVLGYLDDLLLLPLGLAMAIRLIPPETMAECRIEAALMLDGNAPKNRIAACVILLIWLILIAALIGKFFL